MLEGEHVSCFFDFSHACIKNGYVWCGGHELHHASCHHFQKVTYKSLLYVSLLATSWSHVGLAP